MRSPIALASLAVSALLLASGVAIADRGPRPTGTLVVLNKAEASASLIDLASGRIAATVKTGEGPHEVAITGDGERAVVTNYGGQGRPGSSLTVIDLRAGRALQTIELEPYRRPHGIQFAPGGKELLVTSEDSRALLVLDAANGRVRRRIDTGQETSHMVALAPDGRRAYVANIGSGSLTVADLASGKAIATVPTGAGAEGVTVTPDGKNIWVTNRDADTISIVDARSNKVVKELPAPSFPIRVQITRDGRWAVVSCAKNGVVRFYDVKKQVEVGHVAIPAGSASGKGKLFGSQFGASPVPIGIVAAPAGRVYVASAHADEVVAIDSATRRIERRLRAGREPDGLGWSPVRVQGKSPSNREGAKNAK
jgi:YVTN family beta-propeller protein